MARKTTQKTRIFYPYRTPKIPGKGGKNAQKNKEFLAGQKKQGIPQKQAKEGQGIDSIADTDFVGLAKGGLTQKAPIGPN